MNRFEELIRIALVQKKMTISELAETLGVSQPNFSKKLNKNNFNEKDMRKIAEALGMELVVELREKQ